MTSRLLIALCLFACLPVLADDMRPASLSVQQLQGNELLVKWKVPARGSQRLSLDVMFDAATTNVTQPRKELVDGAFLQEWTVSRPGGLQGLGIRIYGLVSNSSDVLLRIVDTDEHVITAVLNVDDPSFTVKSDTAAKASNTVQTYIVLGIQHILIGLDHLLFVACLVYLCDSFRKLLWTITGFTVAHSITLIMAATGVVSIPIPPVETVIALSIVFLAMEIAKQREGSLALRYPVLVSSSFGLLHGFGFASVLASIGLPDGEKITALLSFNIGVEIGQVIFVASLAATFWLLRLAFRNLRLEYLRGPVSYCCGSLATYWVITRAMVV